ncbi:hypothetical protein cypCar_00047842, partial [Cyprinus carpio]
LSKRQKEVKEDIEAIKKCTQRSDEELQQWVIDVTQWAVDTPDDLRTDDPVALQHLIEGLFLGIQQKKRNLYRVTDRNKQRHKIRRWIREDKKKLFNAISQYNDLPTTTESVDSVEDLLATESPIWPWDSDYPSGLSGQAYHGLHSAVLQKCEELKTDLVPVKETYSQIVVNGNGGTVVEEDEDPYEHVSTDASTDDEL